MNYFYIFVLLLVTDGAVDYDYWLLFIITLMLSQNNIIFNEYWLIN